MRQRLLQPVRDELCGLAASDWHESREILPIATWIPLPGADIKPADGCTGVYCVKSRPRGSGGGLFYVDELFPPALLVDCLPRCSGRGSRSRPLGRYRGGVMERCRGRAVPYSQRRRYGQRHRRGPGG
ncbi:MAG: hypothetical protein ACLT98_00465 [Eggerthellaceae bacterium]